MKPAPVEYVAPDTLEEVLSILADQGSDAKLLAGGQSLVPMMNFRLAAPELLVDLNRIDSLAGISERSGGGLTIGGMTRQRALERDDIVQQQMPLLAEIVPNIAHPQIRNRGTLGGSLAHADPAAELPVAAVVLDAEIRLQSHRGVRTVAARDFFTSLLTTSMEEDEILLAMDLPAVPERSAGSFLEVARRHGDYASAGVAARVTLDAQGNCQDARLVYLSAGDIPMSAEKATALLRQEGLSEATIEAAAEIASQEEIDPTRDIHASAEYKRHVARTLTVRTLTTAWKRAQRRAEGATTGVS